jgi:hypothetical protein
VCARGSSPGRSYAKHIRSGSGARDPNKSGKKLPSKPSNKLAPNQIPAILIPNQPTTKQIKRDIKQSKNQNVRWGIAVPDLVDSKSPRWGRRTEEMGKAKSVRSHRNCALPKNQIKALTKEAHGNLSDEKSNCQQGRSDERDGNQRRYWQKRSSKL